MIKEIKKNRIYSKFLNYLSTLDFIDYGNEKKDYTDGMSYVYRYDMGKILVNDIHLYQLNQIFNANISEDEFIKIIKIKHNIK